MKRLGWLMPFILAACQHQLPRLAARGDYDAVLAEASQFRRAPRGRNARALASALVARDRVAEARSVLLQDFRSGGDLQSLMTLADLEAKQGLEGIALVHYVRAATLEPQVAQRREDICLLLFRRAKQLNAQKEYLAAEQDIRFIHHLCGGNFSPLRTETLQVFHQRVRKQAYQQAKQLRTLIKCEHNSCLSIPESQRTSFSHSSPKELLAFAQQHHVHLPPQALFSLLQAELKGSFVVGLISDEDLRAWIGEQSLQLFQEEVKRVEDLALAMYIHLRFQRLGVAYALDVNNASGKSEQQTTTSMITNILETSPKKSEEVHGGWRVFILVNDIQSAELELAASLSKYQKDVTAPAASPSSVASLPSHWSAQIHINQHSLPPLLMLARIRKATDHDRQALEILRYAALEIAKGAEHVDATFVINEARNYLIHGEPWQALAIADLLTGIEADILKKTASAAILLMDASCEGSCIEEDILIAEQVMGKPWVANKQAKLLDTAQITSANVSSMPHCPSLQELLAVDATGPLADVVKNIFEAETGLPSLDPYLAENLKKVFESDLTFACAGQYVVPLLIALRFSTTADHLADQLADASQMIAANQFAVHSQLAMIAGQTDRSKLLAIAAGGASTQPLSLWKNLAETARQVEARDVELFALRQGLLHSNQQEDTNAFHRALLIRTLKDTVDGWAQTQTETGQETIMRQVENYFATIPPVQIWYERERLAQILLQELQFRSKIPKEALALLSQSIWPDQETKQRHQPMFEYFEHYLQISQSGAEELQKNDQEQGAKNIRQKLFEHSGFRNWYAGQELSKHKDHKARRRSAIALGVTGTSAQRLSAFAFLLEDLTKTNNKSQRKEVAKLLLHGLASSADLNHAVPMIESNDDLIRLLLAPSS